jgi:Tol biopolymer transport system component
MGSRGHGVRVRRYAASVLGALAAVGLAGAAIGAVATLPTSASRIAFIGVGAGTPCASQICTVDGAGRALKTLTSSALLASADQAGCGGKGPCAGGQPSFSKDGSRVVFDVVGNQFWELWVMNADGTHLTPLTATAAFYGIDHLTWSPDARTIAFAGSENQGAPLRIWTIRPDGTGLHALTDPSTRSFASEPAWSPNGRLIAFSSFEGGGASSAEHPGGIYIMNADGTNIHRVSPAAGGPEQNPSWSPDGKWLAFSRLSPNWQTDHVANIYRMNLDGTNRRALTKGVFWNGDPVVSPDGAKVIFYRYRGTQVAPHIFVMNAEGTGVRQLLAMEASPFSWAKS